MHNIVYICIELRAKTIEAEKTKTKQKEKYEIHFHRMLHSLTLLQSIFLLFYFTLF